MLGLAGAARGQYFPPVNPTPVNPTPTVPGSTVTRLVGVGSVASLGGNGFRLTPSFRWQRGAVWLVDKQQIANGFQTTFQFRLSNPGGLVQWTPTGFQRGGDGFAFVIQNYGIPVVGPFAGYLGYHGLPNSLAVEFDTWLNYEAGFFDPNDNHISVHSRGQGANSVSESASLGRTTALPNMKDGNTHLVRIDYTPGTLRVYMDNQGFPVLTIPGLNLSNLLRLDNGSAWMGFTAGTGNAYQTHDVLSWQFGPGGFPLVPEVPFPLTTPPSTPMPSTPTAPFVLPPPTDATQPPVTGVNPPY
jgi:hypothetical protein